MKNGQIILIVYAVIVAAGGSYGFIKADSKASLIAGAVCGVLLFGSFLVSRMNLKRGYYSGIGVTAVMCVTFAVRWSKTGKMMPNGMLLILSIVVIVLMLTVGRKEIAGVDDDGGDSSDG
jgi:uncharacterized membrane protein (UPF0136 family)